MAPSSSSKKSALSKSKNVFFQTFLKLDQSIKFLNTNTLFVGLMMFVMNIASRFVNIKLSRTMEGYMKFSFSKHILVFAIAFIGTRDLYWALLITLIFMLFMDYLFNEESSLCCLPDSFMKKYISMLEEAAKTSMNTGNGVTGGMGVPVNNSSISSAPGFGYSTGNQTERGEKMKVEEWGVLTDDEKNKLTTVLSEMRAVSTGQSGRQMDGSFSSLYSPYR